MLYLQANTEGELIQPILSKTGEPLDNFYQLAMVGLVDDKNGNAKLSYAWKQGTREALEMILEMYGSRSNSGKPMIQGSITTIISLKPSYPTQEHIINPKTKEAVLVNGTYKAYRTTLWNKDSEIPQNLSNSDLPEMVSQTEDNSDEGKGALEEDAA